MHRVLREEFFEFLIKLRGKGFIVGDHERRFLQPFNNVSYCKGLAGAGNAQEGLMPRARGQIFHQLFNGGRLISGGFECCFESEFHGRSFIG